MFEAAVEAGADNVETWEDFHEVITSIGDFVAVREALEKKFGEAEKSGFTWKPNVMAPVEADTAVTLMKLIDVLEDNDDVQSVVTNFEVSDEVLQKLMAAG
jgi:transcriptional/translational regulatory protein YebC/TACO1